MKNTTRLLKYNPMIKTSTYEIDNKWMIDIVVNLSEYDDNGYAPMNEVYLWHKDYGIKNLIFGVYIRNRIELMEMVQNELPIHKQLYIAEFMDADDYATNPNI